MEVRPIDTERCYRAVASRDSRFDGVFITAVRTTGIYCRPSCPATTPRFRNVEFFATAAAAQHHGYRACRRCLPDAVPGSPDWNSRSDLAARAMRLISDGVVERSGVAGLAARLGYSERHLTRIVTAELGAGPLALARAHRAHTARLLIETTPMSMADIAFAAGFASVRQFNDTVREVYAVTPSVLRKDSARRGTPPVAGTLSLRLPHREPFDAVGLLAHFAGRALAGLESVADGVYRRTLRLPHGPGTVALVLGDHASGHVRADLRLAEPRDLGPAVARLRRLLDLDADPVAVDALLAEDPALAGSVAETPGIRLPGAADGLEIAVKALLGQQVSVSAARTTGTRLVAALGTEVPAELAGEGPALLFPTAEALAEADLPGPARRAAAVRGLAAAVAEGSLVLDAGRDPAALRSELEALPGVGPWTAGYVAMRLLGDPDEPLVSDLAVRRGAAALGLPDDSAALADHALAWRPWRSYAAQHLWRHA
jgi:AraC family transcriptional regulator, regulatory protein of adaptative response / DNA-3-methyladenine glycosylase II